MTAAAYVRVSSKAQDHATQLRAVEQCAAARGDQVTVWPEKMSGKTLARPVLDELRAAIARGEVRRLYVYRLDRLTRSGIADTLAVVDELRRHGCELVTVADGFSLDGPAAEIILAVMAWAAKMERLAINERISAARARVEGEGGRWGRPRRTDDGQAAEVVRRVQAGESVREVAIALHIPRSTVGRLAKAAGVESGRRTHSALKKPGDPRW